MVCKRIAALCLALSMTAAVGCSSDRKDDSKKSESNAASSSSGDKTDDSSKSDEPVVESIGNLDLSEVSTEYDVPGDFSLEAETEEAELTGGTAVMDKSFAGEFTGSGFVIIPSSGDEADIKIELPAKGSYNVTLRVAADGANYSNLLTIDGSAVANFTCEESTFTDVVVENVLIEGGEHTIGIKGDGGHVYVDNIKIVPAPAIDLTQYQVTKELSNPNASDHAKRLYNMLTDVYGKYTISGQYSGDGEGKDSREFKEIKKKVGKTPAILGLDVSALGLSSGAGGGEMVPIQAADWYNNENGIVTFCWHWLCPKDYQEANGQPWWRAFYTDSVSFDLGKAMSGEDKAGYDAIVEELDNMATQLKYLADMDVPVLWRPLHEAAGDPKYPGNAWFWWGASGKEPYLELWKLMYDKFTNEYGLNNLIWVWNAQNPEWYPGDDYVDIVGYDCYPSEQDSSSQKWYYDLMKSCSPSKSKIIAETENGAMFDPDAAFNDGSRWAWFSTWNGEFTLKDRQLSDQYTTYEMWDKIYNSERVLTLDELPDLKSYPLDTEAFLAAKG